MNLEESRARRRAASEQRQRRARRRLYVTAAVIALVAVAIVAVSQAGSSSPAKPAVTPEAAGQRAAVHHRRHHRSRPRQRRGSTVVGRPTGKPGTISVPVLTYHVIAPPYATSPFPALYVPPAQFAAQMSALKAAGWHAVTLDQVRAYWLHGVPLPAGKPVVITFDNGYHSQYAAALPILRRLHWVADENIQLQGLPPAEGGLTAAEVQGLVDAGWELDTQGLDHADLPDLSAAALKAQVVDSRHILQRRYHVPANWFCYPSGQYNAIVIAAVKAAGYVGSTTVDPGWASPSDDPYALPRLRVLRNTTGPQLLSEIGSAAHDPPPGGSDESSSGAD